MIHIGMNTNPVLLGVCYYGLMFLLTIVFFKPLTGWLKNFKMNLHAQRLDEHSLQSDMDLID